MKNMAQDLTSHSQQLLMTCWYKEPGQQGPVLLQHWLILILAWISNHIPSEV